MGRWALGRASIPGPVCHRAIVCLVQPVAPESRKPQSLVVPRGAPGGHCDVDSAWVMVTDDFEYRKQVIVRGHHHADVILALERELHEIDSQGDVYAFLLGRYRRPAVWVT